MIYRSKWARAVATFIFSAALTFMLGHCAIGAELPSPKNGGPEGGPTSLLFLASPTNMAGAGDGFVDSRYLRELTEADYQITRTNLTQRITPEYLRHFGVVIVSGLPYAGQQYYPGGDIFLTLDDNMMALETYVAEGGGMVVMPAITEFGEAYTDTYNRLLKPFDARLLPQQLRDDANTKGSYASGIIESAGSIGQGLKEFLYPIKVMRWDHAYSATPILTGKDWQVVARGRDSAGSHQAIDNSNVGKRLTDHRQIFAYRQYKKGYVAVSGIHAYYTMSHAYWAERNIGENDTGVIDGAVLNGIAKEGRQSDYGALIDQTFRVFSANSAVHGIGKGTVASIPDVPPEVPGAIDWHTAVVPRSWQHRLLTIGPNKFAVKDDPEAGPELHYYKVLIGPRSAISSGKGTVKEYRDEAIKAGYSAIAFCETFEDIDPAKWNGYVAECEAQSDKQFVCLPGFDIKDFQGGRYLVIAAPRFPDEDWLTKDRKKLVATRMLSLGWYGHIASVHRCTTDNALNYKMYKQYQGITVYTYDGQGKLVDDSLKPYQWALQSDSNPTPITAHELDNPAQVAAAASAGFQQIMPGWALPQAIDYFRFAFPHYFEAPFRYYISEGPVLEGWSLLNKDLGPAELGRDHFRLGIGLKSAQPIAEVKLYNGFDLVGRWTPKTPEFRTEVDGFHDSQRDFLLMAQDAAGKRVLSPGIKTTTRNRRQRCSDRQNWLGGVWIYTGWTLNGLPSIDISIKEGSIPQVPIFDYPFFSNHVQIADADLSYRYVDKMGMEVGGDGKATFAVCPSEWIEGSVRSTYFTSLKRDDFSVMQLDVDVKLRQDIIPKITSKVYPSITSARENNNLLILPEKPVDALAQIIDPKTHKAAPGNPANAVSELPIGSYAGGLVPLTAGLRVDGRTIGFAAMPADTSVLPAGRSWHAKYLLLRANSFHWRNSNGSFPADALAEKALTQMGFRGEPPYTFQLTCGKLDKLAYIADFTTDKGSIAGTCKNDRGDMLLYDVPLRMSGLNGRCATVLWRSDSPTLVYFGCFNGQGYVTFNADKAVDFYAGNVAECNSDLFVSPVVWNSKEAWFRVNNPTDRDIVTEFSTPAAIKNFKPVRKTITVPAGASLDIRE